MSGGLITTADYKKSFFDKINNDVIVDTFKQVSFSDKTVKYLSRVACKSGQSTNICLTVSGRPTKTKQLTKNAAGSMMASINRAVLSESKLMQ